MDFNEENGNLVITVDAEERETLEDWRHGAAHSDALVAVPFESDEMMCEWFDDYLANTEFMWILPEDNGDLTDAPMLGVYGEPERRFAFMDYAIVSVLGRLLDTGKAVFQGP